MPSSTLLFGSDYSYLAIASANRVLAQAKLSSSLLRAIEHDNAMALFPRLKG